MANSLMKRIFYLAILLAMAAGVYVYAYPRLAGGGVASAQQQASADGGQNGGNAGARGGGRGRSGGQAGQAGANGQAGGQGGAAGQRGAGQGGGGQGGGGGRGGFPTAVVTAVAQKETLPITKTAVGYIEPSQTVVLRSRADGTVTEVSVSDGQNVKAGDVLIRLDDRAVQATLAKDQAQIAKDQANADAANAALERERTLFKNAVDPQSSLDAAVAAAKAAEATVTVDKAQLQADQVTLSYMTITAPISGRVGVVNTSVGNIVHASDTSANGLLTITAMDPLRVSFSVAEGDLDDFRNALAKTPAGLPVKVSVSGDKAPRATGKLDFIDSSVDTSSGTIVLKADLPNPDLKLWPGQYVSANTQLGAYTDATTIPLQAVQQGDQGSFVFAVGADQKVKQQKVTVIATVGDKAVVGPEITPGQHVVIEGQLRLTDGSSVRETVSNGEVASAGATKGAGGDPAAANSTSSDRS
ncbi:MAG TPA: efflux RND transporter periplasmic adaptor subunit [Devosia sp.]|nr:efflux RND transporter periplasmic adaptor subunit [Devosia sp.]